jgi:hypothetical protein
MTAVSYLNCRPFSVHQSTHGHLLLLESLIPATPVA